MQAVQLGARARAARRSRAHALGEPRERAAHDRELADDVHQVVELADVDAHRLRDRARVGARPALAPRAPTRVPRCGWSSSAAAASRRRGPGTRLAMGGSARRGRRSAGLRRRASRDLLDARRRSRERAASSLERRARGHQDVELDRVGVRALARGQVRDDLAVRLRASTLSSSSALSIVASWNCTRSR